MFCLTAPDVAAKFRGVTVNDCEIFSRKVFIGGLPVDANQGQWSNAFFVSKISFRFKLSLINVLQSRSLTHSTSSVAS